MTVNFSNNDAYKKMAMMSSAVAPVKREIATVKIGDIQAEEDKNVKKKKKIFGIIGASVGSVALLTIITISALSKGFSWGFYKKIGKISENLQKRIYDLKSNGENLTSSQKIKLGLTKIMKQGADGLQGISNINAVKDSFVYHWCKKLKLQKPVDKINEFFKKIVLTTKNKSYNKAELSTLSFCDYVKNIAEKKNNPKMKQLAEEIKENYYKNFKTDTHRTRSNEAWESMNNLQNDVWDVLYKKDGGALKKGNRNKLGSYITLDLISKNKNKVQEELYTLKSGISNNIKDNYIAMKNTLNDIKIHVNPKNKESVEVVKSLSKNMERYKTAAGEKEEFIRAELEALFKEDMNKLGTILKKESKQGQDLSLAEEKIKEFCRIVSPKVSKKGLAQEAITIIKETYGKNSQEYKNAKKYMTKMNNNLNNAILNEMTAYEKLAELQVGSAPTDLLGIIGPAGLAALLVANSKDKDERISKTLTQGIPILGGICTSYYGTTRMFTGPKNMALGLVTAYLLNLAGTKTNEFYKGYKEKQTGLKKALETLAKFQGKNTAPPQ